MGGVCTHSAHKHICKHTLYLSWVDVHDQADVTLCSVSVIVPSVSHGRVTPGRPSPLHCVKDVTTLAAQRCVQSLAVKTVPNDSILFLLTFYSFSSLFSFISVVIGGSQLRRCSAFYARLLK